MGTAKFIFFKGEKSCLIAKTETCSGTRALITYATHPTIRETMTPPSLLLILLLQDFVIIQSHASK